MPKGKPFLSLQTTITLLVCGVVALSLLVTNILITGKIADNTQAYLEEKATDISRIVAHSSIVIDGLQGKINDSQIQDYANEIERLTNVEYVVVFDMNKIRKSHPNPNEIGKPFVGGDEGPVLKGQEYVSVARGTLGTSLRAFTPVLAPDGKQVGAVAVGIMLKNVDYAMYQSRIIIYAGVGFGLLVGIIGALILARRIKKIMFGLEPSAIAKLLEERSAMLDSVREGILAIDQDSRITLVNAEAVRLFNRAGITGDPVGKYADEIIPDNRMVDVLESGRAKLDQEQELNGITLLTNNVPIYVKGEIVGAIATFRDKTEIKQMAEQLTGVRLYAEALRAQTHEFMNKLHVILGMVNLECYDQLSTYINQIAHQQQNEIGFIVKHIRNPVLAGFLLGKLSYARESGAKLTLSKDSFLPEPANPDMINELVTVLGNLVDNALEAVNNSDHKEVGIHISHVDSFLSIEVKDTGPGIPKELQKQIFIKGYSSKGSDRGLGLFLLKRSLKKLNGEIEIFSTLGEGTMFRVRFPYKITGENDD